MYTQLSTSMAAWLLLTFPFSYNCTISYVLYILLSRIKEHRCFKNAIHLVDSKNERLLLSAGFAAKFGLVFVLTLKTAFS